ncbi:hypothetical protein ACK3TF_001799 [Chlorella vulgaris]
MPAITGCAACLLPAATVRRSHPSRSRPCCHHRTLVLASAASVPAPDNSSSSGGNGSPQPHATGGPSSDAADLAAALNQPASSSTRSGGGALWRWFKGQQESRSRLAALGLAAVLSYGIFDGVSYTIAFSLAFLGYEARTGLNPTANVADIVKICILMWAGNNVTRPFRIAGAAALAPFMDRVMERLQAKLRLENKAAAFAILVAAVALLCFSVLGGLFFSRWVRG